MFNPTAFLQKWFATSTPRQKLTAGLLVFSLLATGVLLAMTEASKTPADPLGSTPLYFVGVFIKLAGVLLLIVACAIIFRRWAQLGPQGKAVRQLRLLETVRLSPKQALHLIAIGDQQLLIGATDQSIALLAPLESGLNLIPVPESEPQSGRDFGSLLQALTTHVPVEPLKAEEGALHA
jgi:flagellar biosynthetic protein FliO